MAQERPDVFTLHLLVDESKITSKAQRVYKIFKPKEVVSGEPFEVQLIFRNNTRIEFPGAEIQLKISQAPPAISLERSYKLENIPPTRPSKLVTSWNCPSPGTWSLEITGFRPNLPLSAEVWTLRNEREENMLQDQIVIPISISTKEEIYQKYSLVIALCALFVSFSALIISIMGLAK